MTKTVIAKSDSNPEGKGVSGFMLDWHRSQPRGVAAKPQLQLLAEMFTSMLALSAKFKYRPVIEKENYLYWINEQWTLSLIAPEEWSDERRAAYAGKVILQQDMTWTISPAEHLGDENPVTDAMRVFHEAFLDSLDTDKKLDDVLPYYVRHLPYYQRLYASALSRSLRTSVKLGGLADSSCRKLLAQSPQLQRGLPVLSGA